MKDHIEKKLKDKGHSNPKAGATNVQLGDIWDKHYWTGDELDQQRKEERRAEDSERTNHNSQATVLRSRQGNQTHGHVPG